MPTFPLDVIPKSGVIREHIDLIFPPNQEPLVEAPIQFVYASILSTLSTISGRRSWTPWFGSKKLYCNAYILLIGESTLTRKTTCIGYCRGYLEDMCLADPSIDSFIFPSAGSPEGIFEELSRKSQGIFIFSEFSSLTDLLEKKYASDLKGFLTDLYDCGYPQTKTLSGKRKIIVQNYCPNMLAGTALDWLEKASNTQDFKSGWYTRFLFVWGEDTGLVFPFPRKNNDKKRMQIVQDLIDIHKLPSGEIELSDKARNAYADFYAENRKLEDTAVKTMNVRLFDYTIKIAMLNALSDKRRKVEEEDMLKSIKFIDWLMINNARLMEDHISFGIWDTEIKKIRNVIKEKGEVTRRDIMRALHLNSRQVGLVIDTLLERDDVVKEIKSTNSRVGGRPTEVYKLSEFAKKVYCQ
jgi:hypothetical protein